jgi:hypothetical protein
LRRCQRKQARELAIVEGGADRAAPGEAMGACVDHSSMVADLDQ